MQSRKLNYRAVVCGVNEAAGQSALLFAESDAQNIYSAFTSALGPARPDTSRLLLGPAATRQGIAHALYDAAQTNPDCVLFYFSGHGGQHGIAVADGLLEYRLLHGLLDSSKTKRKLVVLDACQSGAFARYGAVDVAGIEDSWAVALQNAMPGTRMLFAARSTENANEGAGVRGGHFTWSLLHGLHGSRGTLLVDGQRFVSDVDVFESASAKLIETWPNDARPMGKNLGGDFPMLVSHSAEAPVGTGRVGMALVQSYGVEARAELAARRGVPTNVICNVRDDAGQALSTEWFPLLPQADQSVFTRQFKTPQMPPHLALSLILGQTVWLTWETLLCDAFHGYVIGSARMRVPYTQSPIPSVGLR